MPGEPGAFRRVPIGIIGSPPPDGVPGLAAKHVSQDWLLGLDAPPIGPTNFERELVQHVWHAIRSLGQLDPVLPDV